jgi:ubiquinone/menaquinone biosynthesis C-methylase UbiE
MNLFVKGESTMAWYQESFGNDYLLVYRHRDLQGAYHEVKKMMDWLHIPQGAEVLDLCCGMGRHSMALSEFGYKVTGVDLSEVLLNEAVKRDSGKQAKWLQGDMRDVPLEQAFDAVVNLFTSFGYFEEDEENEKVFYEMNRLLKSNGRFIVDFLNPVYVKATLVPQSERSDRKSVV